MFMFMYGFRPGVLGVYMHGQCETSVRSTKLFAPRESRWLERAQCGRGWWRVVPPLSELVSVSMSTSRSAVNMLGIGAASSTAKLAPNPQKLVVVCGAARRALSRRESACL